MKVYSHADGTYRSTATMSFETQFREDVTPNVGKSGVSTKGMHAIVQLLHDAAHLQSGMDFTFDVAQRRACP